MLHFGKLIGRGALVAALLLAAAALLPQSGARAAELLAQDDRYDIQLTTPFNLVREVDALELDGFDTSAQRVAELKRQGIVTICYLNAGTSEDWRPDARDFPTAVIGRRYDGWAGEHWLDIRRWDILGPIIQRRLEMCKDKGFDGVAFDNLDGYAKRTGFPLTAEDQLAFNQRLARVTREKGLAVALRNDLDQAQELAPVFDSLVVTSCFTDKDCDRARPFLDLGKPVTVVEFTNVRRKMDEFCEEAAQLGVQLLFKTQSLNGKLHRRCP